MYHFTALLNRRPMLLFTMLFILGLLLGNWIEIPLLWVSSGLLFTVLLHYLFSKRITPLLVVSGVLLAGAGRSGLHRLESPNGLSHFTPNPDSVYVVQGRILHVGESKRATPKYTIQPDFIGDHTIDGGYILLYAKDLERIPKLGDTLQCALKLQYPRPKRNPHEFDYRQYLRQQGVYLEAFLQEDTRTDIKPAKGLVPAASISDLRSMVQHQFLRHVSPRTAGILAALILGERSEVDEDTRRDFANTGVIHVLAVSGLHVGYVTLILVVISSFLRQGKVFQTIFISSGLLFYVFLTAGAASVQRAALMGILVILAGTLERRSDVLNTLSTAAFLIVLMDPAQIQSLGFQLSFSAVISIVTLFPVLRTGFQGLSQRFSRMGLKLLNPVLDLFLVSLAAQLGTLPLTIFYFQKIPLISLLANMLVVPLIGLIVAVGLSFLLLGWISVWLASCWGALLDACIDLLLWFVHLCSTFSWAYISTRSIDAMELALLLLAIFSLAIVSISKSLKLWIVTLLLWTNYGLWQALLEPPVLEIVMLDVGQGDAILVHTPLGQTLLIDAGFRFGGQDMGSDVILPYLRYRNWTTIDLLVLTHPHNDHIGGAESLLRNVQVKRVSMPDLEYDSFGYHQLIQTLDRLQIPWSPVYAGQTDTSLAPFYFRILAPREFHSQQPGNINNASIVMQGFYGKRSFLFTGDAEQEVERYELLYGPLLRSDLLKAPHHGSNTSSIPAYASAIKPEVCLISLGIGNKYRHPAPATLKRYNDLGSRILRTDQEGAIIFHSDGLALERQLWRSESN